MQITYQKRNGCIIQRFRNTMLPYNNGDETSMGWKVLNIEYEYNGKYYPEYQYNMLIQKSKQRFIIKKQIKTKYIGAISGPSFAVDLVKKVPVGLAVASKSKRTLNIMFLFF